ncbi:hypothetical protein CXF56_12245 [Psychrobacter sp. Choline-02u-13]|uniref:hypothetical protein n=1 Tax=unclassified Psychrobacter TaxID=196806 RepID=UPI00086E2104|nr:MULTISPECIES: hypothetical protein [unclassified Psychrobacter]OEH66968.1 MAG: hypothetical protein BAX61_08280 [Psychrobacter sp. B29-1]PKG62531.1 hypothetical protein CXF56_12245 [Psychrobacter sp. Choline-02u-13]PKH55174.1 hypothetical protein CXF69_01545 [Psychrobacter sp. Choline-02u-9]TEW88049.1 hypothetical protein E2545_03150 [Psychrobacter sp. 230]|tara:strand:- start:69109 stop:70791 length:1683 start_codon:yes stop_codon:yes gene_type:complete
MDQSAQMKLTAPTLSVTDFNLPSLHLLHDEVIATLKDTEIHLSEFNDDSSQAPLLSDSIEVLKQLSCIFKLISLVGAEALNDAIVGGLQRLYDNGDNNDTDLIMDLSEAIMTLDRYVEFVLLTESVEPTLLIPVINKLNAHSQEAPITADYFSAFGSSSVIIANPEQNFESLSTLNLDTELLTNAYRSGLGIALLNQDGNIDSANQQKLDAMSAACALIAANTDSLFWQAATAAVTDIAAVLPLNLSQKHTLIYLEQQFQSYLPVMDTRFADLVSFACQRDNEQAQQLLEQYANNHLEGAQLEQMKRFLFGPNRELTDTLNTIIQNQINNIKEHVDSYARGDSINPIDMQTAQIIKELTELSSALRLLGLSNAANSLSEAAEAVGHWQAPSPEDFDHLLLALMHAENATIAMAEMHTPGAIYLPLNNPHISLHQLNTANDTLIQESRTAIASAEQAINDYLAEPERDMLNIQNIPGMMRQVAGAVRFLQLPTPASMLSQLANYIEKRIEGGRRIEDSTLACIADVIMAVDHHLDGFENNRPVSKQALDVGQQSLSHLLAA